MDTTSLNRKLIDNIVNRQQNNNYKKGYVYLRYKDIAPYYCVYDLYHIARKLGYHSNWVIHQMKELTNHSRWIGITHKI